MKTEIFNTSKYRFVYAIGDLHGEISKLNEALHEVGFDKSKDLLLSVGDLIDRGEDSLECLKLINEPWFKCSMGNHEKMAFDAITQKTEETLTHWAMNGGDWFLMLSDEDKKVAEELIKQAGNLPLVLEIEHKDKKIIICHADYPLDEYDRKASKIEQHLIWSRERIQRMRHGEASEIKGADLFIFGHTPLKEPLSVKNQLYIDTGAVFGNELTLVSFDKIK
jgi:serine/threonine protein phosphatase 1